ncbi:MAG: signal peptide peptidase SppA [Bdellovibrionales bacterium]|nr:signal peptide peptidase SppA [Bdellovibrionales bacterium]
MSEIKKRPINPLALVLGLSAVLFGLFIVFSFVYFLVKGGDSWKEGADKKLFDGKAEYVAVVELKGVIMDSKKILKNLKDAEEDDDIKAVVLRLNTPGGAVAPSQEIYEAVKKFPKPLVVSMASVAASGGYYIASGAKKIWANPGTLTGSIGVIMEFVNMKKLYDWARVERFSINTGKYKDSGSEFRDMRPDEKQYFQDLVLDTLAQFKSAVGEGRKLKPEEVTAIADGRVFTGVQAKKLHLVDELGTMEDAVAAVAKEAGIKGKPHTVRPVKKSQGLRDILLGGGKDDDEEYEEEHSFIDKLFSRAIERVVGSNMDHRPTGMYMLWTGGVQ